MIFRFNCAYELQNRDTKNQIQTPEMLLMCANSLELDNMTSDIMSTDMLLFGGDTSEPISYLLDYFTNVDTNDATFERFFSTIHGSVLVCYQFLSYAIATKRISNVNFGANAIRANNFIRFVNNNFVNSFPPYVTTNLELYGRLNSLV